ncbi:MAG: tetratricopeptide repeat protein, partial [Thermoanaerobaculia bacterium]
MDTKGFTLRKRISRASIAAALMILAACGRSTTAVTPPDTPTATPQAVVEEESLPASLSEARALRRAAKLELYERGLRKLAESDDALVASRASSLLALHLFDLKRYEEAVPALQAAADRSILVAPFLRLRLIEAELGRENVAGAIAAAEEVIASPETTAATVARLRLPALYAAAGNLEAGDAAFAAVMTIPIDETSEKELVDLAALLYQHGRQDLAAKVRMRLLTGYTHGRFTEKIYGELIAAADSPLDQLPLEEATRVAQSLARANRYDQALDYLQRIRTRFPESQTSDFYRNVYLRSLFNSRSYGRIVSETETEKLTDPSLLFLRARAAWRDDQPQLFLAILGDIEKRYPTSREAVDAKVQRAKYYVTDDIDHEKSIVNLKSALDAGAAGNDGENLWTLGWTYVLSGKDDDALATFTRYLATWPDGDYRTNSLVWSAKVHERNGRIAERDANLRQVIAEYPYNYYAYRAREILGIGTKVVERRAIPPADTPAEAGATSIFPDVEA